MRMLFTLLLLPVAIGAQSPTRVAPAASPAARTFELRPRDGFVRQFEEGYRRHIDWHVGAGDQSLWYMWEIVDGPRSGLYVDGVFRHRWSDFDAPRDPAGDLADNDLRVEPYVVRTGFHAWRERADLAAGSVELETWPLVMRMEVRVRPASTAPFVAALRALRAAAPSPAFTVFELVSGGAAPTFVLWIPVKSWSDVGALASWLDGAPGNELLASAESARRELWRFRPDLSVCRSPQVRCARTIPEAGAP